MRSKRLLAILLMVCMLCSCLAPAVAAKDTGESSSPVRERIGGNAAGVVTGSESARSADTDTIPDAPVEAQAAATYAADDDDTDGTWTITPVDEPSADLSELLTADGAGTADGPKVEENVYEDTAIVTAFVVLEDEPMAASYSTQAMAPDGVAEAYAQKQQSVVAEIQDSIDSSADVVAQFAFLTNSIVVSTQYQNLSKIAALDGVASVFVSPVFYPATTPTEAEQMTVSSGQMTNVDDVWKLNETGYTGKGMTIAVLDTGIDLDHPSFSAAPEGISWTQDKVQELITENYDKLHAAEKANGTLSAENAYYSEKIPFMFNYVQGNYYVGHNDTLGDHGTHVSGIAAANKVEGTGVVGMAPDAQLIAMKVFNASTGSATLFDYVNALEDCVTLGVDVINLSLGSAAGFNETGYEEIDAIFQRLENCDTIVNIAAGNEGTSAQGSRYDTSKALTSSVDNATISSPATYQNVMAIASVNNDYVMSDYIQLADDSDIFYQPTMELLYGYTDVSIQKYAGETLEYVIIDGLGAAEDFANVDVKGKVAVIKRGTLNFGTKVDNAAYAGAIAAVIWDNVEEDIFSFGMTTSSSNEVSNDSVFSSIPAILVSLSDGQKMADAENKSFTVPADSKLRIDSDGGQMSSFSSWGVSTDLRLLPDLSGIGGNVYSCYDGGVYGLMSGTSMATPQICGVTALVKQYLKEKLTVETGKLGDTVEALMMSTANPVVSTESDVEASPRQQGAGLVDALKAVTSGAYLTVDSGRPKAELGDNETGTYSFTFEVNNFSDESKTYTLSSSLLTEDFVTESGKEFMAGYDRALSGSVTFDNNTVTVAAGGTATVTVTITLSDADKAWFAEHYENGGYVEGYIYLKDTAEEGGVDMSLPFLGFYGSWSQVPVFDNGYWYEDSYWAYNGAEGLESVENTAEEYWHVPWVSMGVSANDWLLGLNPYSGVQVKDGTVFYSQENNVISPNGDGYMDRISDFYLSLMRNARYLWVSYTDEADEDLCEPIMLGYEQKTMYNSSYGSVLPFAYSWYYTVPLYDFADCKDGDKVNLTISAVVDYDLDEKVKMLDEATGEVELIGDPDDSITIPITIDTKAPELKGVVESTKDSKRYLTVTIADAHPAVVALMNPTGTQVYDQVFDTDLTKLSDGTYTATLDITGHGDKFMISLGDYGYNQSQFQVTRTGAGNNNPAVDTGALYAYQVYDLGINYYYGWDYMFGWTSVDTNPDSETTVTMLNSDAYEYYAINAAEYVDGYIFAVDAGGNFLYMEPGLWNRTTICNLGYNVIDMAFDDKTDTMYVAISEENDDPLVEDIYAIATLDLLTGELKTLKNWAAGGNSYYGKRQMPWAMTFVDGTLYCCRYETPGLFTLDLTDYTTTLVKDSDGKDVIPALSSGYELKPGYAQSMTYSKTDGKLYWLYCDSGVSSTLVTVDPADGSYTLKGLGYTEYVGALTLEDTDYKIPESTKVTDLALSEETVMLAVGATKQLETYILPWNAPATEIMWEIGYQDPLDYSSDVITIDETGLITAMSAGTAQVIVSCGEDEESYVEATCEVTVMNVSGSFRAFNYSGDGDYGTWQDIDLSTMHGTDVESIISSTVEFAAADYNGHDNCIYGYDANTYSAYKLDLTTGEATQLKGSSDVCDMAYDYSRGIMFAITFDDMALYAMNMRTGELVEMAGIQADVPLRTLACDMDGNLYTIDCAGTLWMIELTDDAGGGGDGDGDGDEEPDPGPGPVFPVLPNIDDDFGVNAGDEGTGSMTALLDYIMDVPYNAETDYGQSMCYDHNNVYGEVLYWCNTNLDTFYQIDLVNKFAYDLGTVDSHQLPQYLGMHVVPEEEMIPPLDSVPVDAISVEPMFLLAGDSAELEINIEPLNANVDAVLYYAIPEDSHEPDDLDAEDPTVAVIDSNGVVTAKQAGRAFVEVIAFAPGTDLSKIEDIYEYADGDGADAIIAWEYVELTVKNPTTSRIRAYDYLSDVWLGVDQHAPAESTLYGYVQYQGASFELTAAEYVGTNGLIYGYASDGAFFNPVEYFTIFDGSTLSVKSMAALGSDFPIVYDMAYDYTSGIMYALAGTANVVSLYYVDLATGALIEIAGMDQLGHTFVNIAVDAEGTIYAMTNGTGELYTIELTEEGVSVPRNPVVWTKVSNPYKSSMSYDYDTGYLYWTPYESLYLIDLNDSTTNRMGDFPGENYALMLMAKDKSAYPVASATLTSAAMTTNLVELDKGDQTTLRYYSWPGSVEITSAVWSSSDKSVATVDENGVVTAIASGKTVITVTLNGTVTASCTVIVYGSNDAFLTYNITDKGFSTISRTDPGKVVNLTSNEEASPVSAMVMIDDTIYAYDEDGNLFTTSAADNFRRTYIGHHGVDVSRYDTVEENAGQKDVATTFLAIRDMTVLEDGTVLALGAITWNIHTEYYLGNGEIRESDWVGEPALIGGSSRLYQVNTETGALTELCVLKDGTAEMSGGNMLQAVDNSLYVYNTANDRIAQVYDLGNGYSSPIVSLQSISVRGEAYQTMGMTYDEDTNCLYMLVNINKNYDRLVKYDIDSGLLSNLGIVGGTASEADLFHGLIVCNSIEDDEDKGNTGDNTGDKDCDHEYVYRDGKWVCIHCGQEKEIVTPPVTPNTPATPTAPSTPVKAELPFKDVTKSDWFYSSVAYVYENGLMNGVGDGTLFDPTGSVTRAMVVQTLYRLCGSPAVSGTNDFTDLTQDWYRDAVQWAYKNGITTGRSETTFAPDERVTREELSTFFYRYAAFCGCDVDARANLGAYSDLSQVSSWAKNAMSWANAEGLILGRTDTTLVPEGTAARSELATILMRYCQTIA